MESVCLSHIDVSLHFVHSQLLLVAPSQATLTVHRIAFDAPTSRQSRILSCPHTPLCRRLPLRTPYRRQERSGRGVAVSSPGSCRALNSHLSAGCPAGGFHAGGSLDCQGLVGLHRAGVQGGMLQRGAPGQVHGRHLRGTPRPTGGRALLAGAVLARTYRRVFA